MRTSMELPVATRAFFLGMRLVSRRYLAPGKGWVRPAAFAGLGERPPVFVQDFRWQRAQHASRKEPFDERLSCKIISSPAGDRRARRRSGNPGGRSCHPIGRTVASMYAIAWIAAGWRRALSNPRAEPQSCRTSVTRSVTPTVSNQPSR